MRMNDYEYDFMCDSRDKKTTARSARSARTHCGKSGSVRFPSDNLTKKELKAMSGECIKYASLKAPMSWEEFKELPNDLKKEYITSIREKFGAPDKYIAEMFGISGNTLGLYMTDLKLGGGKGSGNGKRNWNREEFYAWVSGADMNAENAPVAEENEPDTDSSIVSDTVEQGCSCAKVCAMPANGEMTFRGPADEALNTLAMLFGSTNIRMIVEWSVIEEA